MKNKEFTKSLELIAKSSAIVFIGLFLSKLFTYVYRIIVARSFDPEIYGIFSLAIILPGWLIVMANLGLSEGLVRYISIFRGKNQKSKIQLIFRSSFKLTIFTGIIASIILFFSAQYIAENLFAEPSLTIFLKFFSIIIPLTVFFSLLNASLRSHEYIGWHTFTSHILLSSLNVVLITVLIFLGFGIKSIIFSYVGGISLSLIITFFVTRTKMPYIFRKSKIKKKERSKILSNFLAYSWPLLFASVLWKIFHWADSLIIGFFQGAREVGIYNSAVPIAFLLSIPSYLFLQLFFPIVSREYSKGNKEIVRELGKQVGKWIVFINLPILSLLIIFPEFFINLLFGSQYLEAGNALRLLAIGAFFLFFSDVPNRLIAMTGRSKLIFFDLLFMALINLVLNLALIPKFGIDGAATATMLSFMMLAAIFTIQSKKVSSVTPIRKKIFNIFLAAIISSGIVIYLRPLMNTTALSTILLIILFSSSYILLSFVFKGLDKNDILVIKDSLKSIKRRISS